MATLPSDAITNILCRLGVKDLLRYWCVSKPWCSLIDGPDFIKVHLKHSKETNSNLSLILGDRQLHSIDLDTLNSALRLDPPVDCRGGIEILGCCNGLLAVANSNGETALWNPSTRKYRKVPISDLIELPFPGSVYEFGIVGFGYDSVNDDHKLLRMVHYFGEGIHSIHSEVKVYSLKTNTWKRVCDFTYQGYKNGGNGVFASGSLHWMVTRKLENYAEYLIVAFDVVTEEFREIELLDDDSYDDDKFFVKLAELGGCLCSVCIYLPDKANHIDIWVLNEHGVKESWTKLFSLEPSDVTGVFEYVMPLAYLKSDHRVVLHQDGEIFILYDLTTKLVKNLGKVFGPPRSFYTCVCVRSLVGVGGGDEDNTGKKGKKNRKKGKKNRKKGKKENQQSNARKRDDFLSKGFKLVL